MNYQFGFIGCGNMGGALAQAVVKSVTPFEVALCDANFEKAAALAESLGCGVALLEQVAQDCEYIFLGYVLRRKKHYLLFCCLFDKRFS